MTESDSVVLGSHETGVVEFYQQPLESAVDQGLARRLKRQHTLLFVGIGSLLLVLGLFEMVVALPSLVSNDSGNGSMAFLVLGDWGRRGGYNQSRVADAMARRAAVVGPDFIVSTGDNFYESGLTSVDDEDFDASFREVYHHKELQVPWYAVLGNHDYGEVDEPDKGPSDCPKHTKKECFYSPLHQMDVRLKERDSRWHCSRSFALEDPSRFVDIFFIDTTPILTTKYNNASWATNRGGVLDQDWQSQMEELEGQLARSKARWKLLVGHHPIHSNHIQTRQFEEMVAAVEPLVDRYNVDAYFCGHDHNLQHIHQKNVGYHQIISGAGSQIGTGFFSQTNSPFQYDGNGFVSVEIRGNDMVIEYFGLDSDEPLYATTVHART